MKNPQTIKIWQDTLLNLRLLRAYTGRPMIEVLDKIIKIALDEELENGKIRGSGGTEVRETDGS